MDTKYLKAYAPKARREFIEAIKKRAAQFGIYEDRIAEARIEGSVSIIEGRTYTNKEGEQQKQLEQQVKTKGYENFISDIAYTWFNRLCAIRYMELHDYLDHGLRVLSPAPTQEDGSKWGDGKTPEILDHAQDVAEELGLNRDNIVELKLDSNKEEQLYRELLIGQCHKLQQAMPFLFEALDDETELLLPDNLIRTDSLLRGLINDIPEQDWQQIEIIGWLYQFYISEKKDEVMGKIVKSEDIPAATQLFTPNWIVKYLVQNSVGRKWLQTYPDSNIKSVMEYYIDPAEQTDEVNAQLKSIAPDSIDPETIKVLDPACGSGHILVEAYHVLKSIYEERGYRSRDIPKLILENNLFGIDIDDRAAQLSGFALMMLARADDRRIFTRELKLNVVSMQSTSDMKVQNEEWLIIQKEQERQELLLIIRELESLFEHAKTFGSLVEVPKNITNYLPTLKRIVEQAINSGDLFARSSALALKPIIKQAEILSQKYDVVVANPPYMGIRGMNADLKKFAKDNYPNSKSDMFAIFMEHGFSFLKEDGFNAQVNMQSWMFLTSYEKLRKWLLETKTFVTMAHLGARAFSQISGEVVQTTAWVLSKVYIDHYTPVFFRLIEGNEKQKKQALIEQDNRFNNSCQGDFKKIPGSPIAYWVSDSIHKSFIDGKSLGDIAAPRQGLASSDNDRFLRCWHEVSTKKVFFGCTDRQSAELSNLKWFPYTKGGTFRKWYGNNDYFINWENDGEELLKFASSLYGSPTRTIKNISFYFESSITWSALSSGGISLRYNPKGFIFDTKGQCIFCNNETEKLYSFMGLLNSAPSFQFMKILAPTLDFNSGTVAKVPVLFNLLSDENIDIIRQLVSNSKSDWDNYETSWDFTSNPLVKKKEQQLSFAYTQWLKQTQYNITNMLQLENDNNRLFINIYGLEEELSPEVPEDQITLTVNPKYRYGTKLSDTELDNRFQADTLCELISYAIGCMMGRYSLNREGLIYAHSDNEGFTELVQQGLYNTFPVDDDGIIPFTEQEWFEDDVTSRFREFVQKVWGQRNLQVNLGFIAESLCLHAIKPKSGETSLDTIRRYLSTQFYKDHLKTYKKRPIYWLFSSGKQKAFESLVYLHRYNEGTLSRMRTEYVTPLMGKYDAQYELLAEQKTEASITEQRHIEKELNSIEKKQAELREFDDKLKHYADMQINLDLDDGVKVNYGKFGDLLSQVKAITGKK